MNTIQLKCIKPFNYGKARFIFGKIYSTEIKTWIQDYYTINENGQHVTFDFTQKKEYFIDISEIREEKLNQILS
jgi:arginine decarboxylase-like protein